ncbi:hypothetical protein [Acuticoccus sediminis]|uniref:hypothetical protein n=1 Tax=Acuticoccus sediminis TaxID=2184697 RepID=UPI001CFF4532|nr:hypothetical protein [Acuticoccus sediminis]
MSALFTPVTNLTRACWAEVAIRAFREQTGTDFEDALGDLLCDLMHWADARQFDFALALALAEFHYGAEIAEEAEPFTERAVAPCVERAGTDSRSAEAGAKGRPS